MSFDIRQRYGGAGGAQGAQGQDAVRGPGKATLVEQLPQSAAPAGGGGAALPGDVRAKMEHAFDFDFSAVRIHEGAQAGAVQALAYAQGTDIYMAPGQYAPHDPKGQELLGHELAHVVQQASGRVSATTQAKGAELNDDPGLEREADLMGARAARGERADGGSARRAREPSRLAAFTLPAGISRKVIQRQKGIDNAEVGKLVSLGTTLSDFDGKGSKVAATLDYVQLGVSATYDAGTYDSSYAAPAGTYTRFAHTKDPKKGHDAEAKLLDVVSGKLLLLQHVQPVTRATLHIRGNRGPCNRCQGVIEKFQADFPMVEVKSFYQQETRVENSDIDNDVSGGKYKNGYQNAIKARTAYVGAGRAGELPDDLWYRHLQSTNDKNAHIDPDDEMRQLQAQARQVEVRQAFVARLKKRKDALFRHQTKAMAVREVHTLTAEKQRTKSETVTGYETRLAFGKDVRPTALAHGIELSWQLPAKQSSAWTVTAKYPGQDRYDAHHADVAAQIQAAVVGKLSHDGVASTTPAPGAKRAIFDLAFDTYVIEVAAGLHDVTVAKFDGDTLELDTVKVLVT